MTGIYLNTPVVTKINGITIIDTVCIIEYRT